MVFFIHTPLYLRYLTQQSESVYKMRAEAARKNRSDLFTRICDQTQALGERLSMADLEAALPEEACEKMEDRSRYERGKTGRL